MKKKKKFGETGLKKWILNMWKEKGRKISQSGRRARVGRCVQNSEEFSEEKVFFQIFRPSRLSENSAYDPDCDDTPESASTDCVQSELGRGMGGRISDEIMRQKIFCVACEAIDFFSKDRIVSCTKEKNATAVQERTSWRG